MATIIFGIVVLSLVLVVLNAFTKTNPRTVAVVLKAAGGVGAIGGAALLGIRGRVDLAVTLGVIGLSLLGWLPWSVPGMGARTQKTAGQVSRVRSAFLKLTGR